MALARAASASPENAAHAFSASVGGGASPSGAFLSSISVCNDRMVASSWLAKIGAKGISCGSFQLGRGTDEKAMGDLVMDFGLAVPVTPWLEIRGLGGMSAAAPFEMLIHGVVALARDDDRDKMKAPEQPWLATQLSGALGLRANLDWGFIELGGSYHHHFEGTAVDWAQPSGMFIGLSVGIVGAMHVDPPEPPTKASEPEPPLLPPGPTTI